MYVFKWNQIIVSFFKLALVIGNGGSTSKLLHCITKKEQQKNMRGKVIRNRVPSVFIATSSLLSDVKTK